jgi:hypothetical protein
MGLKYIRERINDTWGTRRRRGPQHGLFAAHAQSGFGGKPASATGGDIIFETRNSIILLVSCKVVQLHNQEQR